MRSMVVTYAGMLVFAAGCHLAGGVSDLRYDDDGDAAGTDTGAGAGAGEPVDSCNDGVHNNDEISTDCGGSCKTCNGLDCNSSADCKSGYCDQGTCRACVSQNHCELDDYCDEPTGICKPEEPEGATCLDHLYCQDHLYCEGSTCVPQKLEGADCQESRECAEGLYCGFNSDTCVPQRQDGQPCAYHIQCLSGYCDNSGYCWS